MIRAMTPQEIEQHKFQFMLARILGEKVEHKGERFTFLAYCYKGAFYVEHAGSSTAALAHGQ